MDVEEFGAAWVRFENGGVMVFQNFLGSTSGLSRWQLPPWDEGGVLVEWTGYLRRCVCR